ncbi:hypothetical protein RRF57_005638 [Xylaria bambusicola]|uniref:Uncharacterized protein n=1 Tax=Xylaria bambusicola TaxID=326684 RepID=A0AAN7UI77_9PEZI
MGQASPERRPASIRITENDLVLSLAVRQLRHSLDSTPNVLDKPSLPLLPSLAAALGNRNICNEVPQERVLENQARTGYAQDATKRPPKLQCAGDDGLLALRRGREHGDEGSRELKALAYTRRHKTEHVGPRRPAAAHKAQQKRAQEQEDCAA